MKSVTVKRPFFTKLPDELAKMIYEGEEEFITLSDIVVCDDGKKYNIDIEFDIRPISSRAIYKEASVLQNSRTDNGNILYSLLGNCIQGIKVLKMPEAKHKVDWDQLTVGIERASGEEESLDRDDRRERAEAVAEVVRNESTNQWYWSHDISEDQARAMVSQRIEDAEPSQEVDVEQRLIDSASYYLRSHRQGNTNDNAG